MDPTLREGDLVLVEPNDRMRLGSIAVVRVEARLIVHRVVRIDGDEGAAAVHLCGDGMLRLDPPLRHRSVLGVAVAVRRGASVIRLDRRRDIAAGAVIARLTRASLPRDGRARGVSHRVAGRMRRSLIRIRAAPVPPV